MSDSHAQVLGGSHPVPDRPAQSGRVHRRTPPWMRAWPIAFLLAFLAAVFMFPVLQLLWLSVVDNQGALTFAHYQELFSTTLYIRVLSITFKIAFWTTIISLVAGYPVAYLLATSSDRTRNSLVLWVLMPFWTSFLVRTFAWIVLLGRRGVVNSVLQDLGITDAPLNLIYNFAGVMVGMSHAMMPLAVLTMLSVMRNIDPNLVKAASTLGARGGQAFWRIYFPLSLPGVAAAGLLVFITSLGFFVTPALLGGRTEIMIAQIIIFQVEEMLNWGFAGAIAIFLLAVVSVVFYLYDRLLGMSTLSGTQAAAVRTGSNPIGRIGGWIGHRVLAFLGALSDYVGIAYDFVRKPAVARPKKAYSRAVLWTVVITVLVFLSVPSFFVIPVSFTAGTFMEWPPEGFSFRWYEEYLSSPVWQAATIRSLVVGIMTAVLSMLLGVPAAFVLTYQRLPFKTFIMGFVLSPLILPHIIVAIALFYFYAQIGLVGTSIGLVLGHTVFAVPFVVVTVMAVLKNYDARLDQAAWTLGANKLRTLWHVTFPLIRPGLIAAFVFAFVKSFDELTVALFISGGLTTTLPKQMWADATLQIKPTLTAVSTVILIFVTAAILLAEHLSRRSGSRR